eukprot:6902382-Prymnesium_polylepis.1
MYMAVKSSVCAAESTRRSIASCVGSEPGTGSMSKSPTAHCRSIACVAAAARRVVDGHTCTGERESGQAQATSDVHAGAAPRLAVAFLVGEQRIGHDDGAAMGVGTREGTHTLQCPDAMVHDPCRCDVADRTGPGLLWWGKTAP